MSGVSPACRSLTVDALSVHLDVVGASLDCPERADGGAVTNLSQKNLTKGVEWSRSGQRTPGC